MKLTRLLARLWPPRTSGRPQPSRPNSRFLAELRRESDIVSSSFEDDSPLQAVVDCLERNQPAEAIRMIRQSLDCSYADARLLAQEVARAARLIR